MEGTVQYLIQGGSVGVALAALWILYKVLSQKQNTDLWKRAGEIAHSKLTNLISSEGYQQLDDEDKAKKIAEFFDKSKVVARAEKVLELTSGLEGQELIKKLSELKAGKLMTKQVYEMFLNLR